MRLAVVLTHPVQYYSPLFAALSQREVIEIKVFYTWKQWQEMAGAAGAGCFVGRWSGTARRRRRKEPDMGIGDKAKNKTEEAGGQAKETTGRVTGNRDMEAEGKGDQASATIKQAGENVKDAFKG